MMQPQQQTVVTGSAPVQPVYVSQPYQTASVSSTYGHRQSSIIGILLIISGCLTIILSVIDIVIVNQYLTYYSVDVANGAACIVSGVMVSNLKLIHCTPWFKTRTQYFSNNSVKNEPINNILPISAHDVVKKFDKSSHVHHTSQNVPIILQNVKCYFQH